MVDEADTLLDNSFMDWAQHVHKALPASHGLPPYQQPSPLGCQLGAAALAVPSLTQFRVHKLLFSATMSEHSHRLAELGMGNAKFFAFGDVHQKRGAQAKRFLLPLSLKQYVIKVTEEDKPTKLVGLMIYLSKQIFWAEDPEGRPRETLLEK